MLTIDLNCDLGEGFDNDNLLMDYITSANIACGFHAGNPATMQRTIEIAVNKGVSIGAHPGLPDLENFGRKEIKISLADAYQITLYQIGALYAFVKAAGAQLHHVKPHGALYNMAAKNMDLAKAIAQAVRDFDPSLILYGLAGSEMINAAESIGLRTASEVFADRTYQDDGTLTPRSQSNALITDEQLMIRQVLMMAKQQQVVSINSNIVPINADTLCLHGDVEHAVAYAQTIHQALNEQNIKIKTVHQ